MRQTKEQILTQFPSWVNHPSGDIVQVRYGDIPDCTYTQENYDHWLTLTGTLSNITYAEAFIYSINGSYDIYKTILGDIFIHHDTQKLMHGALSIPYRNRPITVSINLMYGIYGLSLLDLRGTGKVKGFCNKDGQGSPVRAASTEEMERDEIIAVLSNPLSDYGYGVQKFMKVAKEMYNEDPYNHIMEKTFNL